jgi:2-oxoisovalerate dehydrogenase E1 component alpha subunit
VFACENNGWAISVPERLQVAGSGVAGRAAAYGIPGVVVDGGDPFAAYTAAVTAAERARRGDGPTLLELRVPRLDAHTSSDDDTTYRTPAERQAVHDSDPLPPFRERVRTALGDDAVDAIDARVAAMVDEATQAAEASPAPDERDLLTHIIAEGPTAP